MREEEEGQEGCYYISILRARTDGRSALRSLRSRESVSAID